MAKKESPHIELYMYSLNQEFPASKGHTAFLKRSTKLKFDSKSQRLYTVRQTEAQVVTAEQPKGKRIASLEARDFGESRDGGIPAEDLAASVVSPWTAQWAQNGWIAQWAQNTGT